MSAPQQRPSSPSVPAITVRTDDERAFRFSRPFQIGRDRQCDVRIDDVRVSRQHAIVAFSSGRWQVRDQQSGNGVFVDGRRVESASVEGMLTIRLGVDGPRLIMEVEGHDISTRAPAATQAAARETVVLQSYADRYFGPTAGEGPVGKRTVMIRRAFQKVQKRQRRTYGLIVAGLALVAVGAAGYAYYERQQMLKLEKAAQDIFYDIKSLDLQIANRERSDLAAGKPLDQALVRNYQAQRRQMEIDYERYLSNLRLYDHPLAPQDQMILRVTRLFGECDAAAPAEYLAEVRSYIRQWQRSDRYATGVNRARTLGYPKTIAAEFERQDLPPQFFYLALEESDFKEDAVGQQTRMGYAKGMWQFIPDTAKRYGLKTGPLERLGRPDAADDRQNWQKATRAAASYIKDIYSTDAQASGLLVMASYNWGEQRIINLLRTMPQNPRERNFWKLLQQYHDQVPKDTYDYVLMIVSAAVIGENPRMFGFDFDSPLAFDAR